MSYAVAGRRTPLPGFLSPDRYHSTGTDLGEVYKAARQACEQYFAEQVVSRRPQVFEDAFRQLAAEWIEDTQFQSSLTAITSHPSYQKIISLGQEALPLILRDLEVQPRPWFAALRAISGADPVQPNERGNVAAMSQAWLRWARANNIRW